MRKSINFVKWIGVSIIGLAALSGMIAAPCNAQQHAAKVQVAPMPPQEFKDRLKGPIFSFPTPFTENFEIDYNGIEKLIERALVYDCGVIALTSGNSRYDRLSFEEIKELTRFVVKIVDGRALTIASTGEWECDQVYDYVRYAEAVGASAVQVQLPKGLAGSDDIGAIAEFYEQVASHTRLGIILHGGYAVELLTELIKNESIVAMKEDVDYPYYVNRQILFGDRIAIFGGGNDARYLHGYPYGSPAYYSSLYTYAPEAGREFWRAIQRNDVKTATEIVLKYDLPFISKFSLPMWYAAIAYSGGPQRFIRPKDETLPETNMKDVQALFSSMGIAAANKFTVTLTKETPIPVPRGGHAAGMVDGQLVVAGGNNWSIDKTTKYWLDDVVVFEGGQWIPGPKLPNAVAYAACADAGGVLYVAGGTADGKSVSNKVYRLSSLASGWAQLPDLPVGISHGAAAILDGALYVACGSNGKEDTNAVYALDLNDTKAKWRRCKSLPGAGRILAALATAGDHLYLLGGVKDGTPLGDLYRYDPRRDEWKQLDDLPFKGYAWAAQAIDDKHLLLTGRADDSKPFAIHRDVWTVNLEDAAMQKVGELDGPTTTATLTRVKNDEWWVIGGEPDAKLNRSDRVTVITLDANHD